MTSVRIQEVCGTDSYSRFARELDLNLNPFCCRQSA